MLPLMSTRPRSSLGRVLDDLGVTLLEVVHGDVEAALDIGGVVIHDPADEPVYPESALVLAVGVTDAAHLAALIPELGAHGVPVWCGGMLESGIGRAANVALASLPGFTLPGDVSASGRFYQTDITEPFVMRDGTLTVPTGPGLGVAPLPDVLDELTTSIEWVPVELIPA